MMLNSAESVIAERTAQVMHNNCLILGSSGTTKGILPNLWKAACAHTKTILTCLFHDITLGRHRPLSDVLEEALGGLLNFYH